MSRRARRENRPQASCGRRDCIPLGGWPYPRGSTSSDVPIGSSICEWTAARAAVQSFGTRRNGFAAFAPVDRESVSVVNANVQIELLGQCDERSFFDREGVAARSKAAEEVRRPGRHRHRPECAHQCAQTRSEDHHSPAKANQEGNKNGPESVDFRPVP